MWKCKICGSKERYQSSNKSNCKICTKRKALAKYQADPEARKIYNKNLANRNKLWLQEYFLDKSCADCGETDWVVLEFDHVSDNKKYDVTYIVRHGMSIKTLIKEIDKCEIVCCNCHRRRTAKRANWYRVLSIL